MARGTIAAVCAFICGIVLLATSLSTEAGRGRGPRRGARTGPGAGRRVATEAGQPGPPAGRFWRSTWGPYDVAGETAVSGTVVHGPARGMEFGRTAGMMIHTEDGGTLRVQVCPPWYVDELGLEPQPGDTVEVIGSMGAGVGEIIARQINWAGNRYRVRNEHGMPLWAGAMREDWLRYSDLWNPDRIETITGEVQAVEAIAPGDPGMGRGIGVRLRFRKAEGMGTRHVHLGPAWYLEQELPKLRPGESVVVTGSPAQWGGEEVIIASEIRKGDKTVQLRTYDGRPAWPGGWQNWSGWSADGPSGRLYDPETVQTLSGVIEDVEVETPGPGMGPGLTARVRTQAEERIQAHFGPMWFSDQAGMNLQSGDEVTLTGSLVELEGEQALIVRDMERERDRYRLRLRDEDGTPAWAGRGLGRGRRAGRAMGARRGLGRGAGLGRGTGMRGAGMGRGRKRPGMVR